MTQKVIIKSNSHGISLVLNEDCPFEEILEDVGNKLEESKSFFKDAHLVLQLQGRDLTDEDVEQLIHEVETHSDIHIICVVPKQEEEEQRFEQINQKIMDKLTLSNSDPESPSELITEAVCPQEVERISENRVFHGTLRSGQNLSASGSVIVVGDVNPGATICAGEHAIVIGSLLGNIVAGNNGDSNAYVLALDMNPGQICINGIYGRSSDEPGFRKKTRGKKQMQIARLEDDCITIENYRNDGGK